jgi:hypothetical protein
LFHNRSFENAANLKYLEMRVANQKVTKEEVKSLSNSGNACYHSVQNPLSSRLLSKNVKIRTKKSIILLVILCGYKTSSLILREELRLRMFENMMLRRIFSPDRDMYQEAGGNSVMRIFITLTLYQT